LDGGGVDQKTNVIVEVPRHALRLQHAVHGANHLGRLLPVDDRRFRRTAFVEEFGGRPGGNGHGEHEKSIMAETGQSLNALAYARELSVDLYTGHCADYDIHPDLPHPSAIELVLDL